MGWVCDLLDGLDDSRRAAEKQFHLIQWWEHFGKYLPRQVLYKSELEMRYHRAKYF